MAEVKVLIKGEELKEKDEMMKFIENLTESEKLKLKGFLQGLAFSVKNKK